jgi:uncharacterized cupin superfamily protein
LFIVIKVPHTASDVVFVAPGPEYPHQMINTSDAPLKYLAISTKDASEVVEYSRSGKRLTNARVAGYQERFRRNPGVPRPDCQSPPIYTKYQPTPEEMRVACS